MAFEVLGICARLAVVFFFLAHNSQATPTVTEKENAKPTGTEISLTGPIDARFVALLAKVASTHPNIRRIVVDSDGGENEAALQLAHIVRDRGWDVVVKNKCLSACANYIFPAGRRKSVLPNSWIGIHETRRLFRRADGSIHPVSGNEIAEEMSSGNVEAESARAAHKREIDTAAFYRSLGLSTTLLQDFTNYVSSRKRVLGVEEVNEFPDLPGCPRYRVWALSKKQLEQMGVVGIDDFWFPTNKEEERALYQDNLVPRGSIFIGEAEKLRSFCKGPALSWFERILLKREPQAKDINGRSPSAL
jgi:ATP-dependent protease ClpP protease subunit